MGGGLRVICQGLKNVGDLFIIIDCLYFLLLPFLIFPTFPTRFLSCNISRLSRIDRNARQLVCAFPLFSTFSHSPTSLAHVPVSYP